MGLKNIIDHRTNRHDTRCEGVIEGSWQDNSIDGATQFPVGKQTLVEYYVADCFHKHVQRINKEYPHTDVTLYLYDVGTYNIEPDIEGVPV